MTLAERPKQQRGARRCRSSWMALLAATTVGVGHFASLRAEVSVGGMPKAGGAAAGYRLIVQSYDSRELGRDGLPMQQARPLAATQRAVTVEELEQGVGVDVLHVGNDGLGRVSPVVLAWAEAGQPDLEFDALTARPGPGAVFGTSRVLRRLGGRPARVVLERRLGTAA